MATAETQASGGAVPAGTETRPAVPAGILDRIVREGRFGQAEHERDRGRDLVRSFVEEVLQGEIEMGPDSDTEAMINLRIAQIDQLVSAQVAEIMHRPEFQRLEATWRGLHYLLVQSDTGTGLRVKILNASRRDLLRDLQRAPGFDQSGLFKKVYDEEFGVFGGSPFGALLGDYEFGKGGEDVELLERISQVAAAAHAPFITGASPTLFNMDSFTELDGPRELARIFDTTEYARWKSFRDSEDARYVALTLPRMLLREPYGHEGRSVDAFDCDERADGTRHEHFLWGNAAWALGGRVMAAFAQHGWCASIRGVQSGGLVDGLPVHAFRTDVGDVAAKGPTETSITDRREKELADLGFAPLVHCKGTAKAAFFSVQSAQNPRTYTSHSATANARVSAQLPYIFAVSRFAHYLKCMMRDKVGGHMTRGEAEAFLTNWIKQYAAITDSPDAKARKPLSDAEVQVMEVPGQPGVYRAVAFLRPHFQLEEISVSMRLVADLPTQAR
jgi:type VI secretion system protein ImpC